MKSSKGIYFKVSGSIFNLARTGVAYSVKFWLPTKIRMNKDHTFIVDSVKAAFGEDFISFRIPNTLVVLIFKLFPWDLSLLNNGCDRLLDLWEGFFANGTIRFRFPS
jgi:hypothetical protein